MHISKEVSMEDAKAILLAVIRGRYESEMEEAGGQLWVSRNVDEVRRHVLEVVKRYELAKQALEGMEL